MDTKYYRYTLQGEQTAPDAQSALGDAASDGVIVRVDTVGGQTHVYVASQRPGTERAAAPDGVSVQEVSASDVTKMG